MRSTSLTSAPRYCVVVLARGGGRARANVGVVREQAPRPRRSRRRSSRGRRRSGSSRSSRRSSAVSGVAVLVARLDEHGEDVVALGEPRDRLAWRRSARSSRAMQPVAVPPPAPGREVPAATATSARGSTSNTAGVGRAEANAAASRMRRRQGERGASRLAEPEAQRPERVEEEVVDEPAEIAAAWPSSVTPSTACRMTSIVTFCAIGSTATVSPGRQPIDLPVHQPLHQLRVDADALAVERREQQLPPRQMLGRLEQHDRAFADQRSHGIVAVMPGQRIAGQQSPDRVAVAREDNRRHRAGADREGRPEALVSVAP